MLYKRAYTCLVAVGQSESVAACGSPSQVVFVAFIFCIQFIRHVAPVNEIVIGCPEIRRPTKEKNWKKELLSLFLILLFPLFFGFQFIDLFLHVDDVERQPPTRVVAVTSSQRSGSRSCRRSAGTGCSRKKSKKITLLEKKSILFCSILLFRLLTSRFFFSFQQPFIYILTLGICLLFFNPSLSIYIKSLFLPKGYIWCQNFNIFLANCCEICEMMYVEC